MKLKPNDKIGIISPSSFTSNKQAVECGLAYLRSLGFTPVLGDHIYDTFRYMAGTAEDRVADLHRFFADPEIKAIVCTSGGTGSQYMLPLIDYELIRKNPKPIFGFSDNTALQLSIYAQTKVASCTGFSLKYDFKTGKIDPLVEQSLQQIFNDQKLDLHYGQTVNKGQAEGILLGGCLSLLRNLCGTAFYPDLSNTILLIEDVSEKTYKIDLMLQQLTQCPNFDKVKGIVFGEFADSEIVDPEDGSIDDIIDEFCKNLNIPVIKNFPYGHTPSRVVLPIGVPVRLDADNCRLTYL